MHKSDIIASILAAVIILGSIVFTFRTKQPRIVENEPATQEMATANWETATYAQPTGANDWYDENSTESWSSDEGWSKEK